MSVGNSAAVHVLEWLMEAWPVTQTSHGEGGRWVECLATHLNNPNDWHAFKRKTFYPCCVRDWHFHLLCNWKPWIYNKADKVLCENTVFWALLVNLKTVMLPNAVMFLGCISSVILIFGSFTWCWERTAGSEEGGQRHLEMWEDWYEVLREHREYIRLTAETTANTQLSPEKT